MQRLTLIALTLVAPLTASLADAQVIGTYRPSVVTYYPTSTSTLPAASQPQIAQASYYGAATVNNAQYVGAPIASQSYYASPAVASGCDCAPLRSYPTNIMPTNYVQPVSYAAPVSVPVQPVAYSTQPALGGNRFIGANIFGNPKVYANGQPLRNALRWLGP